MQKILLALGQALRKSLLIVGLLISLSSPFIFFQQPSYAVQGITEMVKPEEKIRQGVGVRAQEFPNKPSNSGRNYKGEKKRPVDVEAEQVKKGAVEEAKVVRDLLTGTKPDGTKVWDSGNK